MPRLLAGAVLAALLVAGCGEEELLSRELPDAPRTIELSSPAFEPGGTIPARFTCEGEGDTPPLRWSGVPAQAAQLVLIVTDPDVPERRYVHWTLYGLPPQLSSIPAGAPTLAGAEQGRNSAGKNGWTPPCPPRGAPAHEYQFDLYWLDAALDLGPGADADALALALEDVVGGRGRLVGRYARARQGGASPAGGY